MKYQLLCLVKFGTLERLRELRNTGRLYMGSVESFKKEAENKDDDTGRYDDFECAVNILRVDGGTLKSEHPELGTSEFKVQTGVMQEYIVGNLACFYGVSSQHFGDGKWKVDIDERMAKLGDYVLFIHDKNTFLKLIEQKVAESNMNGLHDFVKYDFDENTYEGKLSLLQKRKKYSYQNEYRYFLNSGKQETHILELGSLEKVSDVLSFESFKQTTFHISKRELNFTLSCTKRKSEVWDFISTDKRLQLKADHNPIKGSILHLGKINGFSKQITLYENKIHIDEDISWCKNVWIEANDVEIDKEYIVTVLLS